MEWNNDNVLKFLELYMREPIIWHPIHKPHKNRNEVNDAWKRIQNEFEDVSIVELKKKKESLMATFRNCVLKVKHSERSGAGTNEIYKPNWFAYEIMSSFLLHRDTPKNTTNTEQLKICKVESLAETDEEDFEEDYHQNSFITKASPEVKEKRQKIVKPAEESDSEGNDAFSSIHGFTSKRQIERNECDLFGELIALKLKKMDPLTRLDVQHRINCIIHETEIKLLKQ